MGRRRQAEELGFSRSLHFWIRFFSTHTLPWVEYATRTILENILYFLWLLFTPHPSQQTCLVPAPPHLVPEYRDLLPKPHRFRSGLPLYMLFIYIYLKIDISILYWAGFALHRFIYIHYYSRCGKAFNPCPRTSDPPSQTTMNKVLCFLNHTTSANTPCLLLLLLGNDRPGWESRLL